MPSKRFDHCKVNGQVYVNSLGHTFIHISIGDGKRFRRMTISNGGLDYHKGYSEVILPKYAYRVMAATLREFVDSGQTFVMYEYDREGNKRHAPHLRYAPEVKDVNSSAMYWAAVFEQRARRTHAIQARPEI